MQGNFKTIFINFIIWLLNSDKIREAVTKHVSERVDEIVTKLEKLKTKGDGNGQENSNDGTGGTGDGGSGNG